MPFTLPDAWTWDMWFADDGDTFHVYYLKASRALGDPDRRHTFPTVGHAISTDLRSWTEVADALTVSDSPAFDDFTTWTGSVIRDDDGIWRMYYTGNARADGGAFVQRVGLATSTDLFTWTKAGTTAVCEADPTWYQKYDGAHWNDEHWRDPWVFKHDGQWHMLVTAMANHGPTDARGVIGHATSLDLSTWTVQPPLSEPGSGFYQLEVPQVAEVDGRLVLIFSCLQPELSTARKEAGEKGGIWSVPINSPTGPYDIRRATRLTDETLYAGRLQQDRAANWYLFAFHHVDENGDFVGSLCDPLPVGWAPDGRLHVTDGRFDNL